MPLKVKTFGLSSTATDAQQLRAAENYCRKALAAGGRIVGLQLMCGCDYDWVTVPVVRRMVHFSASGLGYSAVRITVRYSKNQAKLEHRKKKFTKTNDVVMKILHPKGRHFTQNVLTHVENAMKAIEDNGGKVLASHVECGCGLGDVKGQNFFWPPLPLAFFPVIPRGYTLGIVLFRHPHEGMRELEQKVEEILEGHRPLPLWPRSPTDDRFHPQDAI